MYSQRNKCQLECLVHQEMISSGPKLSPLKAGYRVLVEWGMSKGLGIESLGSNISSAI